MSTITIYSQGYVNHLLESRREMWDEINTTARDRFCRLLPGRALIGGARLMRDVLIFKHISTTVEIPAGTWDRTAPPRATTRISHATQRALSLLRGFFAI